jgi:hypothetical protein
MVSLFKQPVAFAYLIFNKQSPSLVSIAGFQCQVRAIGTHAVRHSALQGHGYVVPSQSKVLLVAEPSRCLLELRNAFRTDQPIGAEPS